MVVKRGQKTLTIQTMVVKKLYIGPPTDTV